MTAFNYSLTRVINFKGGATMNDMDYALAKEIIEKTDLQKDILDILDSKINYYNKENELYVSNILVKTKEEIKKRIEADYF